jgi:hypothetical protein
LLDQERDIVLGAAAALVAVLDSVMVFADCNNLASPGELACYLSPLFEAGAVGYRNLTRLPEF